MHKIKALFFAAILLFAIGARAQSTDIVYITILEKPGFINASMTINYPREKTEEIELKGVRRSGENVGERGKAIRKKLNELVNEGYEIVSSSTGAKEIGTVTIIILSKEE